MIDQVLAADREHTVTATDPATVFAPTVFAAGNCNLVVIAQVLCHPLPTGRAQPRRHRQHRSKEAEK